jgi:ribonuclease-3
VPDIADLQKSLGVKFRNTSLLQQALVHSSAVNENPSLFPIHNERLEFLGDAVLDFIVAERLYRELPDLTEGEMTKARAALVRRETLARIARHIHLGDFIYMGRGEESTGGRDKTPNLAGAMEAVIAAVYLDRGMAVTAKMVVRLLDEEWTKVIAREAGIDYKSRLQELTQSRFQQVPAYRLIDESGPDHEKTFTVEVEINWQILGRGTGKSKKLAETDAAKAALKKLGVVFTE